MTYEIVTRSVEVSGSGTTGFSELIHDFCGGVYLRSFKIPLRDTDVQRFYFFSHRTSVTQFLLDDLNNISVKIDKIKIG